MDSLMSLLKRCVFGKGAPWVSVMLTLVCFYYGWHAWTMPRAMALEDLEVLVPLENKISTNKGRHYLIVYGEKNKRLRFFMSYFVDPQLRDSIRRSESLKIWYVYHPNYLSDDDGRVYQIEVDNKVVLSLDTINSDLTRNDSSWFVWIFVAGGFGFLGNVVYVCFVRRGQSTDLEKVD